MGSALLASWPWDNLGFYKVCTLHTLRVLLTVVAYRVTLLSYYPARPSVFMRTLLDRFVFFLSSSHDRSFRHACGRRCGAVQYVLYGPLVGKAVASRAWEAASPDRWILLLLVLFGLRALTYQLWSSFSNMLFATRRRRILRDGVDYDQIDKEWDWYVDRPVPKLFFLFPTAHHIC
jgi:hypothetical protein